MNDYKIEPFAIIFPKTSAYIKSYGVGATKWMYFLIEDEELLKNIIVFGIKSAIVWYAAEATDFHDKKIPKVSSNCTCLAVILIDFFLKKDENYCLQVFLKDILLMT